ncbi:hypothetical protein JYU34_004473 [Plutella xylostella]|uniref:Uncharacterized protein n=2 Tax=Plutella xylostella TaxID=51655 RepID=A0ABQ7QY45_PLUXY|nr:eukaryotic translation initiation factor 4B [Plutella xylostella]KAG7309958.1 hypothetical protein JYU34_004473 [Plutella xylostella]CAG9133519.1 unnamed protein product [Plutella xylostella]
MAATGKKGKKQKWIPANITDILAEPTTVPTTANWADSVEEEQGERYGSRTRAPVQLPSASRAARGGLAVDDESIPHSPPFVAHISNLPYDVDESAITELFDGMRIINLRLPREGDRLKGYGYIDFEDRESLINAMNLADLTISGRRIRIEVSTHDYDRRMGRGGGRSDRDREYDPERTMGDWRSGPRAQPENRERERDRDRPPRTMDREGMRERERDSSADNKPGGWRDGDRPAAEPARTPYGGRDSFGRDRDDRYGARDRGFARDGEAPRGGYGGRDGFRTAERDGGAFGSRDRDRGGFGGRGFGDRDRDRDPPPPRDDKPRERPKLNLLPRTVPRETEAPTTPADGAPLEEKNDKPAPKPVSKEKVFGAAKPVDTAAKEREIEERLRKQEEESRRATESKDRWGPRKDHSGDRRGGARRDDRDRGERDSRSYNRDRQDYPRDDRDRRDYSKDDRDRRDYSKDNRDRRDYSKDDRDRRDYSKDDRDRRDYSKDDKDRRDAPPARRDYSKEDAERRDYSPERRREPSAERRQPSGDRDLPRGRDEHRNGKDAPRPSRSRERHDDTEKPLPKLKEQEKPNFVASNKFSFLTEDGEDAPLE